MTGTYIYRYRIRQFLKSFARDTRGSLLPMIAACVTVLIAATGVLVDSSRAFMVQDILQKSLDYAGLAAGHTLDLDDMESDANEFFAANVDALDGVGFNPVFTMDISDDDKVITMAATAQVTTVFGGFIGVNEVTVAANTQVTRDTRGMELVLVLDSTGSMASDNKMENMKDAAEDLVEIVYGDEETNTNLYVGVVPFVTTVNVGSDHTEFLNSNWTTNSNQKLEDDYYPTEWKGCVAMRGGTRDRSEDSPTVETFEPFLWEDDSVNDWIKQTNTYGWVFYPGYGWYWGRKRNNYKLRCGITGTIIIIPPGLIKHVQIRCCR